jgi:hypothetical protein
LVGSDGGLVWIVAGVWTVRALAGRPLGAAWGIACLGAGLRWGTVNLADIAVATRLAGPTVVSGSIMVKAGMATALVGALIGEAQATGFGARTWAERLASAGAIAALVPLFLVRGAADPHRLAIVWWGVLPAVGTASVLLVRPALRPVPAWVPTAVTTAGVALAVVVS